MSPDPSGVPGPGRTFFQEDNDLRCRALPHRLLRFLRARLRRACSQGTLLADDPRVVEAWLRGWDASHYVQLRRWHDQGFRPRVVYDVGANNGAWAEMCQAVLAPEQVFLFEPQSDFQRKAAARQPPGAAWQVLPVALGAEDAAGSLYVTRERAASSLLAPRTGGAPAEDLVGREEVQVATLDGLLRDRGLPPPDLVKIDVQGYESHVLAGGRDTLARARRLIVEVGLQPTYRAQALLPEILQALATLSFAVEHVEEAYRRWPGPVLYVDLWLERR